MVDTAGELIETIRETKYAAETAVAMLCNSKIESDTELRKGRIFRQSKHNALKVLEGFIY